MSSFQEGLMSRRIRFWLGVIVTGSSYLLGRWWEARGGRSNEAGSEAGGGVGRHPRQPGSEGSNRVALPARQVA